MLFFVYSFVVKFVLFQGKIQVLMSSIKKLSRRK